MADEVVLEQEVAPATAENPIPKAGEAAATAPATEEKPQEVVEEKPQEQEIAEQERPPNARPGWDKAQQKRDEEIAQLRQRQKEQDERMERMLANLERQATAAPKTEMQPAKDTKAEVRALLEEAEKVADEDPYKAAKLNAAANRKLLELQEQQEQWRKQQEDTNARTQAEAQRRMTWESQWVKENPDLPLAKGHELVSDAWKYAATKGLTGEAARGAAQVHYEMNLAALKKTPPTPATKPTSSAATKPTAANTAGTAPSSVRPVESGARPEAQQYADAAKGLTELLMRNRR